MKRNGSITAFYFETLLLIVVFLGVILVLTQVFGLARQQSAAAEQLTDAVTLAGNAAEAVSCSESVDTLLQLLNEENNAVRRPDGMGVLARYNAALLPAENGDYCVEISWVPESSGAGQLIRSEIRVLFGGDAKEVYRLQTAAFKEAGS